MGHQYKRVVFLSCSAFAFLVVVCGWSSKKAPLFEKVHQMAIENVLKTNAMFSSTNLEILIDEQRAVDQDQKATQSFEHAMTGLEKGETTNTQTAIYIKKTDDFVRQRLTAAIQARIATNMLLACTNLGMAIHALEDSTSPAHTGFQSWSYDESWWEIACHIFKERSYPSGDKRMELEGTVRWAFDIFSGPTNNIPPVFFNSTGTLQLPSKYTNAILRSP